MLPSPQDFKDTHYLGLSQRLEPQIQWSIRFYYIQLDSASFYPLILDDDFGEIRNPPLDRKDQGTHSSLSAPQRAAPENGNPKMNSQAVV